MLYFSAANVISVLVAVLSAGCMYLAYDLTRITAGAPRAWYVMVAAFAVLFISKIVTVYYDILSPAGDIGLTEAIIALVVLVLFVVGLSMLDMTFRRRLRVSEEESSNRPDQGRTVQTTSSRGS